MYKESEEKLRKVLKEVSLEDYKWDLISYDRQGNAIVIIHCLKCKKDFRGTYGLYTNDRVSSLFLNFRKSHIMSIKYIQSWCSKKVLDWCNHP